MKIHDVRQGSDEWISLRLGRPTASEFDSLISPLWEIRKGAGPATYLYNKLTEHLLGVPLDTAGSFAMEQGSILEGEAIPFYEFSYEAKVQRVGFCTTDDGRVGCSPDGLIGEDGGIEVKCPQPETHLKYLMQGGIPKDYLAQVHGSMFVTGRAWWVFLSYCRHFPALVLRVERDEEIQVEIGKALKQFTEKFDAELSRIKAMKA